jgi:hypothetical protein
MIVINIGWVDLPRKGGFAFSLLPVRRAKPVHDASDRRSRSLASGLAGASQT